MILWYFFHKYFIQKKNHSLYAVCHCLTEKAMASSSEFGLVIEVTDGPKTLLSKLKSVNTSDLIVDVFTDIFLSFICMLCECSMSGKFVFNICFYSC